LHLAQDNPTASPLHHTAAFQPNLHNEARNFQF